jgi:hypothetical protein
MKAMLEACLEKMEANPEEMESVENQEVPKKRPQWTLSEHGMADVGTDSLRNVARAMMGPSRSWLLPADG